MEPGTREREKESRRRETDKTDKTDRTDRTDRTDKPLLSTCTV